MSERARFRFVPLPMPEDYTAWDGGELPGRLRPDDYVDVWFRMGRSSIRPKKASDWHWLHTDSTGDILGYRRATPRL
jgi:hypothetical protein